MIIFFLPEYQAILKNKTKMTKPDHSFAMFVGICCGITLWIATIIAGGTSLAVASDPNSYCGYSIYGNGWNKYTQTFQYVESCDTGIRIQGINLYARPDFFCFQFQNQECTPTNGAPGALWLAGTIITTIWALVNLIFVGFLFYSLCE
jgi:hypothetical protein